MSVSPCSAGLFRFLAVIFVLVTSLIFIRSYMSIGVKTIRLPRWLGECSSLLGQGLWTRAEKGRGSRPPSIPGAPGDMTECGLAFGTPAIVGWEVREDTPACPKPGAHGEQRSVPRPWPKHVPTASRASLEMRPEKEGREKESREGRGRKLCIECLPPALAVPPPGTLFAQIALWPAPSQPSGLCSDVTSSDAFPDLPATAAFVVNVIYLFFTWLLSVSTLWSVSFLKARILACAHPSL